MAAEINSNSFLALTGAMESSWNCPEPVASTFNRLSSVKVQNICPQIPQKGYPPGSLPTLRSPQWVQQLIGDHPLASNTRPVRDLIGTVVF